MHISSLFRSAPIATLPSYTSSQISHHAKEFIKNLSGVKNTAENKGFKVSGMYRKTENYANKLLRSAEKGNLAKTMRNIEKLKTHSGNLFSATSSPTTRGYITAAQVQRLNISSALSDNKFSLR